MAKHGKLRTFLEYSAAKSVLAGFSRLPAPSAMRLGRAVGGMVYVLAGDLRRTGATNLRLAFPEKSDEERARLLRDCFANLGRLLGFFSQYSSRTREELTQLIEVQGLENLVAAKKSHGQK